MPTCRRAATAFQNTLTLAPVGTLLTLLAAYPVAYCLALQRAARWRLFCWCWSIVPFWTSLLMRTYAWIFILGGRGMPALLGWLGLERRPRLINTPFAVLLGIVYGYLPLMVLPIYVSLEKLDRRLLEASADLCATPLADLPAGDAAAVAARRRHRLDAGVHPADGRVPDPGAARRRQGVLHRQCAGRPVPAVAQLAVRRGGRGGAGGDHAGDGHHLYALRAAAAAPRRDVSVL